MEAPSSTSATILLLDIPPGALCGIDLISFTTSPRFHGIKLLPLGSPHFVYAGATASLSIRHGVWIWPDNGSPASAVSAGDGQIIVKRWDDGTEELRNEENRAEEAMWKGRVGALWNECLMPYKQSLEEAETGGGDGGSGVEGREKRKWDQLVDCITPGLLTRITGASRNNWKVSTSSSMERDRDDIPGLTYGESNSLRWEEKLNFLPIDLKKTWREGAIGRERTEAAKDRSWALGDVVVRHCAGDEMEIVGELQFCFLMVLTLGNYSCLEQWKRLLSLILTCQSALRHRENLYIRILRLLWLQLARSNDVDEEGLFDLSDEGGNMLVNLLKRFRRGLEDEFGDDESAVKGEFEIFKAQVKREYGWDLSDSFVRRGMLELEDGEQVEMELDELEGEDERCDYAPVIVNLEDNSTPSDTT